MKLILYLAILAAAAQGHDITVEDVVSVVDTSSQPLMESTTKGALPVGVKGSSSISWKDTSEMDIVRILKANQGKIPTRKPTRKPTKKSPKKPTSSPTAAPTAAPTSAPTATPTAAPTPATPSEAPSASPAPSPTPSDAAVAPPTDAPVVPPTDAPVVPPTKTPAVCFPGDAIVTVEGKGRVRMRDVKIGDRVLGMGGKFHPIYAFGHRSIDPPTDFIRLYTNATTAPLEISSRHFVFLYDQQEMPAVPALLKVGDVLLGAGSTGAALEIIKIETVTKNGVFAPLTADGTIAVNGVVASSYVFQTWYSFDQPSDYVYLLGKIKIMSLSHQAFSHMRHSPLRLASLGISPWFGAISDKEGRNMLSCAYEQAGTWMHSSTHGFVVALGTVLFYSLCGISFLSYLVECLVGPVMGPTVIVSLMLILTSVLAYKKPHQITAAKKSMKVKIH